MTEAICKVWRASTVQSINLGQQQTLDRVGQVQCINGDGVKIHLPIQQALGLQWYGSTPPERGDYRRLFQPDMLLGVVVSREYRYLSPLERPLRPDH